MVRICTLRVMAVLAMGLAAPSAQAQELRAFWADAFSPGIKSRQEVDEMLRRLRTAGCNAVFVQVRKSGDAYYQSRYDPWASDNPERFDGLEYLIRQAHSGSPRIQVHAWINTCAIGGSRGNPLHISVRRPDWLSLSDKGETYDGEAVKIDPGHPEAADLTARVYLDVLRHYDVDGIHFDFVRYGGTNWGYNPVSVARFNARYGRRGVPKPEDPLWQQWRRDQVTALVRRVYLMAAALKPDAAVSAATISWGKGPETMAEWRTKTAAMTRVFQDWRAWMEEGILDYNCLMSYYREDRHAAWFRLWLDWAKDHQYRRYAVPASGIWLNTIPNTLKQIQAIRAPSKSGNRARGVMLYSYAGTNRTADGKEERYNEELYEALGRGGVHGAAPFATPATPPPMPWKTQPVTGHIRGVVLDAESLAPVDGALVNLRGPQSRSRYTDGSGFFGFVDVVPGTFRLVVQARGYAPRDVRVEVRRGQVSAATVLVGASSVPFVRSGEELRLARDGAPVRIERAVVVGGMDHFVDRCYIAFPGEPVAYPVIFWATPAIPLQAGDVIAARGILGTEDGERVIRDAQVQLIDMEMPPTLGDNGPWSAPGLGARTVGVHTGTGLIRVAGVVRSRTERSVLLDTPVPVEVMLTGRKGCGIEDVETPLPTPALLSRIEVTGVVSVGSRDGETFLRVRPANPEEIREVSSTARVVGGMALRVALAPMVMMGVAVRRRRNGRSVRG